jgi:hypothetical protein
MFKYGRLPKTEDKRDLLFANYVDLSALPPVPDQFGHEMLIAKWQMLGNGPDPSVSPGFAGCGNCTFAGGGHETMLWTAEGSAMAPITGKNIVSGYSAFTGYNPETGANDNGAVIRDVLKYRYNTGLIDSNGVWHKIGAFLSLDIGNLAEIYAAMYIFSACELGINVPHSAEVQFNSGLIWDYTDPESQIMGGHDIPLVCKRQNITCVTWAKLQQMTTAFFNTYCDEAWAILSPEMITNKGTTLEGFNLAQLKSDLADLTGIAPTKTITYQVGEVEANFFGQSVKQDVAPTLTLGSDHNGHLMTELTPMVKSLGGTVSWQASTQTATVVLPL